MTSQTRPYLPKICSNSSFDVFSEGKLPINIREFGGYFDMSSWELILMAILVDSKVDATNLFKRRTDRKLQKNYKSIKLFSVFVHYQNVGVRSEVAAARKPKKV